MAPAKPAMPATNIATDGSLPPHPPGLPLKQSIVCAWEHTGSQPADPDRHNGFQNESLGITSPFFFMEPPALILVQICCFFLSRLKICRVASHTSSSHHRFTFTVPKARLTITRSRQQRRHVQWMQDAAPRHPQAIPNSFNRRRTPAGLRASIIEYLPARLRGDQLEVRTWIVDVKRVRAQQV